ncbi:hypothetical protein [Rhodococcus sp. IEGM 1379]|uniref:hypothetical protein n=1 Tax=Rhodococcus sp. IEGM 1379 TaxID=3047086 RepID=UPI0024B6C153|nr:hypothetical protein [Rhodococcus sp. IEGM 1379]MDI9914068.1 hypothetical protein [Rhodococcus sp. IEGM 1379]
MTSTAQIACRTCSGSVTVEKLSWQHTTVQWDATSLARCTELSGPDTAVHNIAGMRDCPRLRENIRRAVVDGAFGDLN